MWHVAGTALTGAQVLPAGGAGVYVQSVAQHPGDANPPAGALVFWGPADIGGYDNPDGHVALSLGGGEVISTAERNFTGVHTFTIAARNAAGYPYLGWMMPYGVSLPAGEGYADIIATEPNGPGAVSYKIGYNDGTGLGYTWGGTNLVDNAAPTQMAIGDLNGDGRADILVTEPSGKAGCNGGVWYMVGLSNGDGTFNWQHTNLLCNTPPTQLGVGRTEG